MSKNSRSSFSTSPWSPWVVFLLVVSFLIMGAFVSCDQGPGGLWPGGNSYNPGGVGSLLPPVGPRTSPLGVYQKPSNAITLDSSKTQMGVLSGGSLPKLEESWIALDLMQKGSLGDLDRLNNLCTGTDGHILEGVPGDCKSEKNAHARVKGQIVNSGILMGGSVHVGFNDGTHQLARTFTSDRYKTRENGRSYTSVDIHKNHYFFTYPHPTSKDSSGQPVIMYIWRGFFEDAKGVVIVQVNLHQISAPGQDQAQWIAAGQLWIKNFHRSPHFILGRSVHPPQPCWFIREAASPFFCATYRGGRAKGMFSHNYPGPPTGGYEEIGTFDIHKWSEIQKTFKNKLYF